MERFFGDGATFFILRLFSLFSLIGTIYFILLSWQVEFQNKNKTILFFALFIVTLPLVWWDGKLIFPEFSQCFLIATAYYLLYGVAKKTSLIIIAKTGFAFFLLGFCLGLKFHAGAVIAFFMVDDFFESIKSRQYSRLVINILMLLIGFFFCNPIALTHTTAFIANIRENGAYFNGSWETFVNHWDFILTGRYPEWDLVYFVGMNGTSIPLINFCFLLGLMGIACGQKNFAGSR